MRISDWSSDVCSSDLAHQQVGVVAVGVLVRDEAVAGGFAENRRIGDAPYLGARHFQHVVPAAVEVQRIHLPGAQGLEDRKSVVSGKSVSVRVDLGGRRILNKKKKTEQQRNKKI